MIVDGLHLSHYEGEPEHPRIVMIHGALDRHNSFRRSVRRLEGANVTIYDRRGYGRSEAAGITCDFSKHVADLMGIIGDEPAVVIGHSMGGLISLFAAATYPKKLLAVGAFEPPMPWTEWWPSVWIPQAEESDEEVVESFHERIIGPGSWSRIATGLREQYVNEGHALRLDLEVGLGGPLFDPVHVTAPVVMGHGRESSNHHIQAALQFAAELPDATNFAIEGSGHGAHRSHPDAFADFVAATLARVRGPREPRPTVL